MRWCVLWLLLAALLGAQSLPDSAGDTAARTAHVEGQVLSQTGEPLRKAILRLTPYGSNSENAVAYTDTSDSAGNFVIEGVLPGRYSLSAQRGGYLTQLYGARSGTNAGPAGVLTLAAGQVVKDLSLKLIPQGVMTGRVTDTDGDPLWGIQVQALKVYGSRGQRHISTVGSSATDDQGSFRIPNLSPGSYYVVADNLQSRTQYETVRPGRAPNRLTNVATYYPNAVDAASAVALDIAPGSELHGIEIQMRSEAAFSIRGVAIYAATGKPVIAALNVRLKNNEGSGLGSGATHSRGDGTFELRNLLPGVYVISASSNNTAEPGKAREEVTITDSDITGVKLALAQGAAMAGIIKLEGAGPLPVHPMIVLTGVDGTEGFSNTQPKDDGTFELHGIAPAKYAAMVYGLPDGVYVKSVRVGGQDVTHSTIDFTSGVSGTLDILLSPRAAEVLGTVRNKDGGALPGGQVTLWPRKLRPENVWSGPAQSATDQNGDFRIAGLAPGEYYAIAWEEIELGLTYELDFLKRFESQATTVTLEEGSHQTAQPKLISREAAAAEAAKLN